MIDRLDRYIWEKVCQWLRHWIDTGHSPVDVYKRQGYDQVLHDVCIQKLPVFFGIDRSGLVGADGETHQGIFDISYLSHIPNMVLMAPKNEKEMPAMMKFALEYNGPTAMKYPRGSVYDGLSEYNACLLYTSYCFSDRR